MRRATSLVLILFSAVLHVWNTSQRPSCHVQPTRSLMNFNSRRSFLMAAGCAVLPVCPCQARDARDLSGWELSDLEKKSRSLEGVPLPSGVRVIDLVPGDGPEATDGQQVFINYKFWRTRFDDGTPVDSTFLRGKGPEKHVVGSPSDRVFEGLDAGIKGMREGGWRRLIVPPALGFGKNGYTYNPQSSKSVPPGSTLYVDVRLVDAGSGRCRSASERFTTGLVNVKEITIC
eukprot:TRINITY_DN61166_c0_g1_i1.p1 TRINITY_DN61166_c0_g1~~TRINITY_DN61166_c0_g1_i1.p1  ORF type:complete len:231 (+),score=25.00 TRINITY_DN61166_c0_g1_i1:71-763(+)